ncbi:MAG: STAS domain-containing protein [Dokdonella sp.]|nr:STAS domain-containing protein [Dokdonella sp.]
MAAFAIERGPDGRLRPSGRIDYANAPQALADGERLAPPGSAATVDLAALESSDTVTLGVLIAWSARAAQRGGVQLRYVNFSEDLAALAQLCDVEPLLRAS